MCLLTCRHRLSNFLILFFLIDLSGALAWSQAPHNLILFIPDGLRPESVNVFEHSDVRARARSGCSFR